MLEFLECQAVGSMGAWRREWLFLGKARNGPREEVLASEELGGIIRPEEGCAKWSAQQTRRQGGVMLPVYPGDWGLCGELTRCMVSRI